MADQERRKVNTNMQGNRMKEGTGENSYANTSIIQASSIKNIIPMVRDTLKEFYDIMTPKCVMVAELGCAFGDNSLMMLPPIIDVSNKSYRRNNILVPEIIFFMNDLPGNDYNSISRSLETFDKKLIEDRKGDVGPYFISFTPGSFHKRIFPSNFLHFLHTSNSAHWLSQVPKGLLNMKGENINKGNIYISKSSAREVLVAYRQQFIEDFTAFLESRGEEIVSEGRMVVNIMATMDSYGHEDYFIPDMLNLALKDMANEGSIDVTRMDEFDFPFYPPTTKEIISLIEDEGSFRVTKHEIFDQDWDMSPNKEDINARAKFIANPIQSATVYMMAAQFGEEQTVDMYTRVTRLIVDRLENGIKLATYHHAIALIKNKK